MSVASAPLTPAAPNKPAQRVDTEVLHLDDLPKAMDKMGWKISAQLMRRWFSTSPAWKMPQNQRDGTGIDYQKLPASRIDSQIVKMKWLLTFGQVVPIFNELYTNWNSEKGREVLRMRLRKVGWTAGATATLGYGLTKATELETTCQINARVIGSLTDTLDDYFGSIFKATLKLAVIGRTTHDTASKKDFFVVDRIGIYLRDTYDFNAGWFEDAAYGLGIWSKDRVLSKADSLIYMGSGPLEKYIAFHGFVPVRNKDFRRWQDHHNSGCDFYVFSDVYWAKPNVAKIEI